jgi:hypothetical protein
LFARENKPRTVTYPEEPIIAAARAKPGANVIGLPSFPTPNGESVGVFNELLLPTIAGNCIGEDGKLLPTGYGGDNMGRSTGWLQALLEAGGDLCM